MEKLCKKSSTSQLLVSSHPFPHAPPYLWPTASTVCNFLPSKGKKRMQRGEKEKKKGQKKKVIFRNTARCLPPRFYLSTILFLPRLGCSSCYPPPYPPPPPPLPRSYLPRGSFHSMEFQSCPWRRLATRAFPIFHSALHKERRPIGI